MKARNEEEAVVSSPDIDLESYYRLLDSLNVESQEVPAGREKCWSLRGCDGLMGLTKPMQEECPHNRSDCYRPCPEDCTYTACARPWHRVTTDVSLLFDTRIDRGAAVKKACYSCEFFLTHGPKVGEATVERVVPEASTSDSSNDVTIHLF